VQKLCKCFSRLLPTTRGTGHLPYRYSDKGLKPSDVGVAYLQFRCGIGMPGDSYCKKLTSHQLRRTVALSNGQSD
jgi:hypothetical protein